MRVACDKGCTTVRTDAVVNVATVARALAAQSRESGSTRVLACYWPASRRTTPGISSTISRQRSDDTNAAFIIANAVCPARRRTLLPGRVCSPNARFPGNSALEGIRSSRPCYDSTRRANSIWASSGASKVVEEAVVPTACRFRRALAQAPRQFRRSFVAAMSSSPMGSPRRRWGHRRYSFRSEGSGLCQCA